MRGILPLNDFDKLSEYGILYKRKLKNRNRMILQYKIAKYGDNLFF